MTFKIVKIDVNVRAIKMYRQWHKNLLYFIKKLSFSGKIVIHWNGKIIRLNGGYAHTTAPYLSSNSIVGNRATITS